MVRTSAWTASVRHPRAAARSPLLLRRGRVRSCATSAENAQELVEALGAPARDHVGGVVRATRPTDTPNFARAVAVQSIGGGLDGRVAGIVHVEREENERTVCP